MEHNCNKVTKNGKFSNLNCSLLVKYFMSGRLDYILKFEVVYTAS